MDNPLLPIRILLSEPSFVIAIATLSSTFNAVQACSDKQLSRLHTVHGLNHTWLLFLLVMGGQLLILTSVSIAGLFGLASVSLAGARLLLLSTVVILLIRVCLERLLARADADLAVKS